MRTREAWLTPGSPLEADAMTANPFLGVGTLDGTFALAEASGKGVFVLAATSNPEAFAAQRADARGGRDGLVGAIIAEVSRAQRRVTPGRRVGEHRLRDRRDRRLAGCRARARSLRPRRSSRPGSGIRAPGPPISPLRFGELAPCVIASESRSILEAGPTRLGAAIEARASEYRGTRG